MQPANLVLRAMAAIIDGALFGLLLGVIAGFADAAGNNATERLSDTEDMGTLVLLFAGYAAYFLIFEWLTGTSPGKRIFRLRVVTTSGERIDGSAAFMRNIIRPIDALFAYGVGFVSVILSPTRQRLGDRAAGTMVIRQPRATSTPDSEESNGERRTP